MYIEVDMKKMEPLKYIRMTAGKTQQDLADAVGVTRQHIQKLEAHKSLPTIILAQRIADELGCTVADLWPVPKPEAA